MNSSIKINGCNICWPLEEEAAWEAWKKCKITNEIVNESHFVIRLHQCTECGQIFVFVFSERIDWEDNNDPQRHSIFPVSESEAQELLDSKEKYIENHIRKLSNGKNVLESDYPSDAEKPKLRWVKAAHILFHD